MKKLGFLPLLLALMFACETSEEVQPDLKNTENSILITGINESISYTYTSANGRVASSVPDDVHMLQVLILDEQDLIVYEQYYYNHNAYYEYGYDSADYGGDEFWFENTIPDTLYIPALKDGTYTVIASTAYAYYDHYDDHFADSSGTGSAPVIAAYTVSEGPIFVDKKQAAVSSDTDQLVVMEMENISARVDLEITSSTRDWYLELQVETKNNSLYSFATESFETPAYDYDEPLYMWSDGYATRNSFYFLPKDLNGLTIGFYDYRYNFDIRSDFDIDPDLSMKVGDVFTLSINVDELVEGGGSASFTWEDVNWNDVGEITVP